jgi:hypothetical protein
LIASVKTLDINTTQPEETKLETTQPPQTEEEIIQQKMARAHKFDLCECLFCGQLASDLSS